MKHSSSRQIEQLWEQAVEQATTSMPPTAELDKDALNTAVGLQVKSGVAAGKVWGAATFGARRR